MGKKFWKVGDIGYIFTNEMGGIKFQKPEKVQVISILTGDLHPVKVKALSSGSIYYRTEKEIQTRAAKAERALYEEIKDGCRWSS